jgi:hypothetical protein
MGIKEEWRRPEGKGKSYYKIEMESKFYLLDKKNKNLINFIEIYWKVKLLR